MGNNQIIPKLDQYAEKQTIEDSNKKHSDKRPWFMCTYGSNESTFLPHYNDEYKVYTNYPKRVEELLRAEDKTVKGDMVAVGTNAEPFKQGQKTTEDGAMDASLRTAQVKQIVTDIKVDKDTTVGQLVNDLITQATLIKQFDNNPTQNIAWAGITISTSQNNVLKDEDKVSLLFHWLTSQEITDKKFPLTFDPYSVTYHLTQLQNKDNTYAAVFALLCACVDIPCVIVRGLVKGGHHDPGVKISDKYIREWNAVLVDGTWRLVDTFWGALNDPATNQQTTDDWYLFPDPTEFSYSHHPDTPRWQLLDNPISRYQFEDQAYLKKRFFELQMTVLSHPHEQVVCKDGKTEFKFQLRSKDYISQEFRCVVSQFKELENLWKLVDLDGTDLQVDFIQTPGPCYTDNIDNLQILQTTSSLSTPIFPKTKYHTETDLKAHEEGCTQNCSIDDAFFDTDNELYTATSNKPQRLVKGMQQTSPRNYNSEAHDRVDMDKPTTISGNLTFDKENQSRELSLKVHFPEKGVYKVEIVGRGTDHSEYDWIAIYRVFVTDLPVWQPFFPKMEKIGWGPNKYLKECRLRAVSHGKGEISCNAWETVEVKLHTQSKSMVLYFELIDSQLKTEFGASQKEDNFKGSTKLTKTDENGECVWVWSKLMETEGHYKLTFKAEDNGTYYGEVVHYLLVCSSAGGKGKYIRECCVKLNAAIQAKDLILLEKAMDLVTDRDMCNDRNVMVLYQKAKTTQKTQKSFEDLLKNIERNQHQ